MRDTKRKGPQGGQRSNEEEYFARREAELLRQHRDALQRKVVEAERKSHHLKCPKCGFSIVTTTLHHVEIDQCPNCLGVWLDAAETEAMLKTTAKKRGAVRTALLAILRADGAHDQDAASVDDYFTRRAEALAHQHRSVVDLAAAEAERRTHRMKCPKCGFDLLTTTIHEVDIDQCPHCHGVWFDSGEAEEMLRRTEAERGLLRSSLLSIVKAVSGARARPE